LLASNIVDDITEKAYHELTNEIKDMSPIMNRVYGKTTRSTMLDFYLNTDSDVKETALYPVSIKIKNDRLHKSIDAQDIDKTIYHVGRVDKFFCRRCK
jgi:hypothetical protein